MSFRCCSFLLHQIVVDILVVGIPEGLVRHPVLEYIADALNRLASCLVVDLRSSSSLQCITKQVLALLLLRSSVVEEAVDVGVTVKVKTDSYGVNFFEYISDVINKAAALPPNTPLEKYRMLLPDKWKENS